MRILYGVQATGNGHITRARTLLPALQAAGVSVDFVFSGRDRDQYFDMECFGRYRCFRGFTFDSHKGRVRWPQTIAGLRPSEFWRDNSELDLRGYDLVLTDFEPVSAWAAKRQGVPSVGLAHQYALRHRLPGTPQSPWLRWGIGMFAPAQKYLGVHWQSFGEAVLPPLIQTASDVPVSDDGFVLVYLPFESLTFICRWLKPFAGQRFRVYAPTPCAFSEGHIEVLPLSRTAFPQDLARCSGVICNSGFGLCSEAMSLGKKILTRPLQGQIEQHSNAMILQQSGHATVMHDFQSDALANWLQQPAVERVRFPEVAQPVAAWIAGGCLTPPQRLADAVWQQGSNAHADSKPARRIPRPSEYAEGLGAKKAY